MQVPARVDNHAFWNRYFFKVYVAEMEQELRQTKGKLFEELAIDTSPSAQGPSDLKPKEERKGGWAGKKHVFVHPNPPRNNRTDVIRRCFNPRSAPKSYGFPAYARKIRMFSSRSNGLYGMRRQVRRRTGGVLVFMTGKFLWRQNRREKRAAEKSAEQRDNKSCPLGCSAASNKS